MAVRDHRAGQRRPAETGAADLIIVHALRVQAAVLSGLQVHVHHPPRRADIDQRHARNAEREPPDARADPRHLDVSPEIQPCLRQEVQERLPFGVAQAVPQQRPQLAERRPAHGRGQPQVRERNRPLRLARQRQVRRVPIRGLAAPGQGDIRACEPCRARRRRELGGGGSARAPEQGKERDRDQRSRMRHGRGLLRGRTV